MLFVGGGLATIPNYFVTGLVLAIMILPIVSSLSREVMSTVPADHKEAALGLGATRWEMIRTAVLPYCRSGISGAAMLGLGRAIGETIAVTILDRQPIPSWEATSSARATASRRRSPTSSAKPRNCTARRCSPPASCCSCLTLLVNAIARLLVLRASRSTRPKRTAAADTPAEGGGVAAVVERGATSRMQRLPAASRLERFPLQPRAPRERDADRIARGAVVAATVRRARCRSS